MPQADSKSSSVKEQQQSSQDSLNPYLYPQHSENNHLDLYELWLEIWNRKWIVFTVTIFAALGSLIYAMQLQNIYKAEALLNPPKAKNVQELNLLNVKHDEDIVKQKDLYIVKVFNKFQQNIHSRVIQKQFIQEKGLMELLVEEQTPETRYEDIYNAFSKMIKVIGDESSIFVSMEMNDPDLAAKWVNELVEFTDKKTIDMEVEDLQNSIANRIKEIDYRIKTTLKMEKIFRKDTIKIYEEALTIAKELGIRDRVGNTNYWSDYLNTRQDMKTPNSPLYLRGYLALNAEIATLKNRESDDPFTMGLRELQQQKELMQTVKFDKSKLSSIHIDQLAYPPKFANEPNRRMIISLTTVFAFILGIILALFLGFIKNQRKISE